MSDTMVQGKNVLLVTWDFTRMSENALLHAIKLSQNVETKIRLVHVIKPGDPQQRIIAEEKIKKDISRIHEEQKILCEWVILEGSLFSAITIYIKDSDAIMVVMGTHGIRGPQKYFGSHALKVIIGSEIPYIVIHDKPTNMDRYANIVFPIDFKSENKEKLQWAIYLGKYFNSKVHLFKAPVTDSSLVKKVNVNLNFAIRFLIQNNLDYEIHTAKKYGSFGKEIVAFAKDVNADLILITTPSILHSWITCLEHQNNILLIILPVFL
jgi:nucleotide-binding universal stress UspA family protein